MLVKFYGGKVKGRQENERLKRQKNLKQTIFLKPYFFFIAYYSPMLKLLL